MQQSEWREQLDVTCMEEYRQRLSTTIVEPGADVAIDPLTIHPPHQHPVIEGS